MKEEKPKWQNLSTSKVKYADTLEVLYMILDRVLTPGVGLIEIECSRMF